MVKELLTNDMAFDLAEDGEGQSHCAEIAKGVAVRANANYVLNHIWAAVRFSEWSDMMRFCVSLPIWKQ